VAPCTIAAAELQPEYISCDGFTVTFQNRNISPLIKTFYWDFGLPGNTDTSNLDRPTFTFPDTGIYKIMLITNKGIDCSDTAYSVAKVYPGFNADYFVADGCKNVPLQFKDLSTTKYGVIDYWKWSFGNPQINPDTSSTQNPTYAYPNIGTYQIQLIVGNSKGCRDTLDKVANVLNKPTILVSNDTLICSIRYPSIECCRAGTITWSPNYMISDVNVPNPLVSPDVPTKYYVTLNSAPGCSNTDSVLVNVKTFVTLNAGPDTTICLTDTIRLNPLSDALSYRWTPTASLNNANIKNPIARPTGNITYSVTANIGKCQASDAINISTVPYPTIVTSIDTAICYGDHAQLSASGGIDYRWIPATGLSDSRIANPVASPTTSTVYRVAVIDNKGCPKPAFDSVAIRVVPEVPAFAGNDTAIVVGQPLQLNASGGTGYRWGPPAGLSNVNIRNPVANLSEDFQYAVRVSTPEGCFAIDTIKIRVFKTAPDILCQPHLPTMTR
jgi:PKD repeat protein